MSARDIRAVAEAERTERDLLAERLAWRRADDQAARIIREERMGSEAPEDPFVDVTAALAGDTGAPTPKVGVRADGLRLLYPSAVNIIFGEPESAKTFALQCIAADTMFEGGSVLWLDIDHNGAGAIVSRFRELGVPASLLRDRDVFRIVEPDDAATIRRAVELGVQWAPTMTAIDSVGELIPMFGGNSDSGDDFTRINREVGVPLATVGSAVAYVDHVPKDSEAARQGPIGTQAKRRASALIIRSVAWTGGFVPGSGGHADWRIFKDRHGGLRKHAPRGEREPVVTVFEVDPGDVLQWRFGLGVAKPKPPSEEERAKADAAILLSTYPDGIPGRPTVKADLGWGTARAERAVKLAKELATASDG